MDIKNSLDKAFVRAMRLAESTHAALVRWPDGSPEHLGDVPYQPGQYEGGSLRKTATVGLPGTRHHLSVSEDGGGWSVKVLDKDGIVLYSCGPGGLNLDKATKAVGPSEG